MIVKLINSYNVSLSLSYKFPFFLTSIQGIDGLKANIFKYQTVNQDGSTYINSIIGERDIEINGVIKGYSKNEINNWRRWLIRFLNPKDKMNLILDNGTQIYKIECIVESAPIFMSNINYNEFSFTLNCPSPYFEDVASKTAMLARWEPDFRFPLNLRRDRGKLMGYRVQDLIIDVINNGDVPTGMLIEFKALRELLNPSIINIKTREFIKINKRMITGEVITINTNIGYKKIMVNLNNIISNGFRYLDLESTFLQLDKGKTRYRYNADENIHGLQIKILFNQKYLGI